MNKDKIQVNQLKLDSEFNEAMTTLGYQQRNYITYSASVLDKVAAALGENIYHTEEHTLIKLKATMDSSNGKLRQAYQSIRSALFKRPMDLSFQLERIRILHALHAKFQELCNTDLFNEEIGSIYQILFDEGWIAIKSMVVASSHFIRTSNYQKAWQTLEPIASLFPNTSGLQQNLLLLQEHYNFINITKYQSERLPTRFTLESSQITPCEMEHYIELYYTVSGDKKGAPTEYLQSLVTSLSKQLDFKRGRIDPALKDLWYCYAILLDNTEQLEDSLELLYALSTLFPAEVEYQTSYLIVLDRLISFCEVSANKTDGYDNFIRTYEILYQHHLPSLSAIKKRALVHLSNEEFSAAQKICDRVLQINPTDHDHLELVFEVAKASGVAKWITETKHKILEAQKLRPWEVKLFMISS